MSKYNTIDVWNKCYGNADEVYDYAGRLMKKSACGNPNSKYHSTLDHIRPLSKGGSDVLDNIVVCHRDINAEKSDKFPAWKANGRRFHAIRVGIAFGAHTGQGQMDYAGLEYIGHPVTVYLGCDTEDERIVALLHDVVEDTKVTLEDLSMFFDEKIIEALRVISHPKKYDKKQYMIDVKNNPIARKVKIEDLKTNMDKII